MTNFTKMTDRSVVATCLLGSSLRGTGLSGMSAASPASLASLPIRDLNERPTQAPEAAVAIAGIKSYAFAATGAGFGQQATQHHTMWAFRGLEPWSDPV
ncbi:hypothetical protein OG204_25270 [Streptomyces sp. NBC_01387]|uniref:hypothetical protein n=1 Tax=unclassified Streptomyces TaxID=2593676 RepID=UPI00202472FA|nr:MULTISPECIES: hypothetical protein [unclassified Streptomyces]MCX4548367.1 hypothetical protein [Streptomyces sp. NBC_01500]WSC19993.1 hypothetical protein OIE60_10030 [Streptomyces sp. NBC_01766]WSV54013.1 hypothetical protein OG282_09965 [Streptomyces sp. NBC_01014]